MDHPLHKAGRIWSTFYCHFLSTVPCYIILYGMCQIVQTGKEMSQITSNHQITGHILQSLPTEILQHKPVMYTDKYIYYYIHTALHLSTFGTSGACTPHVAPTAQWSVIILCHSHQEHMKGRSVHLEFIEK